jgi:hypothetical protein
MSTCLTQDKATEMTLLGMSPTGPQQMPWDSFYNLILAHAKLHDHSTASTTKTTRDANIQERGGGRQRGGGGRRQPYTGGGPSASTRKPRADDVFSTVMGPNMIMKANIKFKPEEWNKLTDEQKTKIHVARSLPPRQPRAPPTLRVIATQVIPNVAPTPSVPVPSQSHLRQVLSKPKCLYFYS